MITSVHTLGELLDRHLALSVERLQIRPLLNLPNLRVNRVSITPGAKGINVTANIANVGTRISGPFFVMTTISRNGQQENRCSSARRRWRRKPLETST